VQRNQTATLVTADKLPLMPDDGWTYELDRGDLTRMSPAGSRTGIVTFRASLRFGTFVEQQRSGVRGSAERGFRLASNPDTVRVPGIEFVRSECIPV